MFFFRIIIEKNMKEKRVGLFELFLIFFQIGAFTLGGGYAMLSMVEMKIVTKKGYLGKEEFWDLIAVAQTLPGVFAINTALYVGHKLRGKSGAFFSMLGAALPSFIAILLIAMFFMEVRGNEYVERLFRGIRPCVVALILSPAVNLIFKEGVSWKNIALPLVAAFLIFYFKVNPIWVISAVILFSLLYCYVSTCRQMKKK
jgi:chromate transporter